MNEYSERLYAQIYLAEYFHRVYMKGIRFYSVSINVQELYNAEQILKFGASLATL